MSKLDEIVKDMASDGPLEGSEEFQDEYKQKFKALFLELVGTDEIPKPKPQAKDIHERIGTCWDCYEMDYCIHEIRDELRSELREKIEKL